MDKAQAVFGILIFLLISLAFSGNLAVFTTGAIVGIVS